MHAEAGRASTHPLCGAVGVAPRFPLHSCRTPYFCPGLDSVSLKTSTQAQDVARCRGSAPKTSAGRRRLAVARRTAPAEASPSSAGPRRSSRQASRATGRASPGPPFPAARPAAAGGSSRRCKARRLSAPRDDPRMLGCRRVGGLTDRFLTRKVAESVYEFGSSQSPARSQDRVQWASPRVPGEQGASPQSQPPAESPQTRTATVRPAFSQRTEALCSPWSPGGLRSLHCGLSQPLPASSLCSSPYYLSFRLAFAVCINVERVRARSWCSLATSLRLRVRGSSVRPACHAFHATR